MFNFNLQKRAFDELNAEQFRLVYLLNNTLSMVNETTQNYHNNKIEMYNGYMMDKLGLSERQVQRLIKGLEQLGYITVKRATTKKSPNIITINCDKDCDKNGDKNGDKNVTLNKNTFNKTKEIYKDFSTCSKSTCNEENNIKEKNIKKEMELVNMGADNCIIQSKDVNNSNSSELSNTKPLTCKSDNKKVNNNIMLINMKENARSDNGTTEMNVRSEMKWNGKQGRSNASECVKETITSTQGNNKTSTTGKNEYSPKNEESFNDSSIFIENCFKPLSPQIALTPLSPNEWKESQIFGAGSKETTSAYNLPTQGVKTQHNAQECPQTEYDHKEWCKSFYDLLDSTEHLDDLAAFKANINVIDGMMETAKQNTPKRIYGRCYTDLYSWCRRVQNEMDLNKIILTGELIRKCRVA